MPKKKADAPLEIKPSAGERDYETEGHLRTLMDAEVIKQDPEKMAKVHKLAGKHHKAIRSIQDIRAAHQEKFGPKKPGPKADPDGDGDNSDLGT
jgi:hypothetical protein